jgi:hypothetical protein
MRSYAMHRCSADPGAAGEERHPKMQDVTLPVAAAGLERRPGPALAGTGLSDR